MSSNTGAVRFRATTGPVPFLDHLTVREILRETLTSKDPLDDLVPELFLTIIQKEDMMFTESSAATLFV